MSSIVIIIHMRTFTTIVFNVMVAKRNLVDERSKAKWGERIDRELWAVWRSTTRLRVLPRRLARLRAASRRLLVQVSQAVRSTALLRKR